MKNAAIFLLSLVIACAPMASFAASVGEEVPVVPFSVDNFTNSLLSQIHAALGSSGNAPEVTATGTHASAEVTSIVHASGAKSTIDVQTVTDANGVVRRQELHTSTTTGTSITVVATSSGAGTTASAVSVTEVHVGNVPVVSTPQPASMLLVSPKTTARPAAVLPLPVIAPTSSGGSGAFVSFFSHIFQTLFGL